MKRLEEEQAETNRKEIASLVEDTRKACLEAKNSAELDALLLRCAKVQMVRARPGDPLAERTARRLQGVVSTLNLMGDYLDWKAAGNTKRANEMLRNLRSTDSGLPILTMEEIESRFVPEKPETQGSQVLIVKVFEGVDSPADMDQVLVRLTEFEANPAYVDKGWMQSTRRAVEALQQAWKAVELGDHQGASRSLLKVTAGSGADPYLEPLKFQIERRILTARTKSLTGLEWLPDEDYRTFAGRVLDEMHSKGNYEAMIELMKIPDSTARAGGGESYSRDRPAIEQYLAAKRLENVGDDLGAVSNYRAVVGMQSPGKYAPIKEAEEAMKHLKEKNPDAFKNYDVGLAEDIRLLRQQIQNMTRMQPGYRPTPNYP